jgi:hypothetical protein
MCADNPNLPVAACCSLEPIVLSTLAILAAPTPETADRKATNPRSSSAQDTDVRYIFLVGGFAESKALQHSVRNELETDSRRVIVPLRPGLAVLKGAVMLGLGASERFASRLAKLTYGVDCCLEFDKKNPDHAGRPTFKRMDQGKLTTNVSGCFSKIVEKGTRVSLKQIHMGGVIRVLGEGAEEKAALFRIFTAPSNDTKWVTDEGVVEIGKIHFIAKPQNMMRVDLCFGASEIRATVVNTTTGAETPAVIEYDFRRISHDDSAAGGGAGAGEQVQGRT